MSGSNDLICSSKATASGIPVPQSPKIAISLFTGMSARKRDSFSQVVGIFHRRDLEELDVFLDAVAPDSCRH